ncbi:alcohol oxidase [Schizopora paradoxa]|uniref:Alcohol oxidase n=1 Tax=Schizopora paradoxa TaxID=27342 RepID=A0A0H2S4M4_9AGAM|nr:alcohol oxidase [Schizopora paradoxa]
MPFTSASEALETSFDYVVIGGGTAGITVATRLAERSDLKVLLIEAGEYHGRDPLVDVPGFIGRTIANPKFDWAFKSTPQSGANHRVVPQPRGKGLGGSSLINYLGIFRPSKEEIDSLEKLGNKGWNWESILHSLKNSESPVPYEATSTIRDTYAIGADPDFHGVNGPIKMSFPKLLTTLHARLFTAGESLGIPKNKTINDCGAIGSVTPLYTLDPSTTTRSYAASGYLETNLHRKNLFVLTNAQVTKINFETKGLLQRTVSVDVLSQGTEYRISKIQRDIILSSGTLQTPQLLELSGIGHPDILSRHGIRTLINLPGVGENLQDHVGVTTIAQVETVDETVNDLIDPVIFKKHEELYANDKTGLLSTVPAAAFMFLPSKCLGSKEDIKAVEETMRTQSTKSSTITIPSLAFGLEKQYAIQRELFNDDKQAHGEIMNFLGHLPTFNSTPEPGKRYTTLSCSLTHPLSRGSVHIASADPLLPPEINPNYLANKTDLNLLVGVVEFALKLYNTKPLADHVKSICLPPQEAIAGGKEGLKAFVRDNCRPIYHPVGTASMLPRGDGGVVDASLKVYGTSNLRVVDLSILPLEPSCHTQSLAYAIGEKAADIIKAEISEED